MQHLCPKSYISAASMYKRIRYLFLNKVKLSLMDGGIDGRMDGGMDGGMDGRWTVGGR